MGRFQVLICTFLCLFLNGCLNYYHHPNGGYRPKKSKFYLQNTPYKLKPIDKLKTNVIYFSNDTLKYGEGKYNDLFYYRFFNDGRFYKSAIDVRNMKNIEMINKPGFVGYYKIKDNLIEMEYFFVKHKEKGWYIKDTLYIKNNILSIEKDYEQNNSKKHIYTPKKIEGLNQSTDW